MNEVWGICSASAGGRWTIRRCTVLSITPIKKKRVVPCHASVLLCLHASASPLHFLLNLDPYHKVINELPREPEQSNLSVFTLRPHLLWGHLILFHAQANQKKLKKKKVMLLLLDQIMPSLSSSEPSGSNGPNTLTSLYFTCPPFVSSHLMFLLSWIEAGVRQALMKDGCRSDDPPREGFSDARGLPVCAVYHLCRVSPL